MCLTFDKFIIYSQFLSINFFFGFLIVPAWCWGLPSAVWEHHTSCTQNMRSMLGSPKPTEDPACASIVEYMPSYSTSQNVIPTMAYIYVSQGIPKVYFKQVCSPRWGFHPRKEVQLSEWPIKHHNIATKTLEGDIFRNILKYLLKFTILCWMFQAFLVTVQRLSFQIAH